MVNEKNNLAEEELLEPTAPLEPLAREQRFAFGEFLYDLNNTRRLAKKNHLALLAGGIAFLSMFTACPFFILSVSAARYLLAQASNGEQSLHQLRVLFETLFPDIEPAVAQKLFSVVRANPVNNLMGVALLCWSTYELFKWLHIVFEKISTEDVRRNAFFASLVSFICFLTVGGASAVVLFLFTAKVDILKSLMGAHFSSLSLPVMNVLISVVSLCFAVGSISFIYKFLPSQPVSLKHAVRGSLLFLMFFMIGRASFQLYVQYYQVFNANIYGAFFKGTVLMAWIYFLTSTFLFSAQYAIYLEAQDQ